MILVFHQDFFSCTFSVDLELRIFEVAGIRVLVGMGDGVISVFHHPLIHL